MESLNDVWEIALREMREEFSEALINLWFTPLEIYLVDSDTVEVRCETNTRKSILKDHHLDIIKRYLKKMLGFDYNLIITSKEESGGADVPVQKPDDSVRPTTEPEAARPSAKTPEPEAEVEHIPIRESALASPATEEAKLSFEGGATEIINYANNSLTYKDEYTFENYIVGSSNKFVHAACYAVANATGPVYNPLFIHGPSGLGKTHLLYAITNCVRGREPDANIIFVKGEDFTNQLIECIQKGIMAKFREKYRGADVLLIDDIQFIAGKDSTQEEFFHTFNALYESHKQIIVTSDRPPKDIKTLEDRLKTRFEWGLVADVQLPDYELRMAIVKKKANLLGLEVPEDVFVFLVENLTSNIRQLEGAIKRIGAQSYLTGVPISKELAIACTSDIITGTEPVKVTVDKILEKVAKKYSVPIAEIKGRKRTKEIAFARHIAVYLVRKMTDMSLPAIAKVFGRDHTTIMSSIDTIDAEMKASSVLELEIGELIKELRE